MFRVAHGPPRLVLITFRNPSTMDDVHGVANAIKQAMIKSSPTKSVLAADFRIATPFTPDVLQGLTSMMTRDNVLMGCSAVLMSRNAVGLQIYNAVRSVSTFETRMVSSNSEELLDWLRSKVNDDELRTIADHFSP